MNDGKKGEFVASKVAIGTSVTWKHCRSTTTTTLVFLHVDNQRMYINMAV